MPDDFDVLVDELADAGLDESYIERLKKWSGSPLRKERNEARQEADALKERVAKAEAKTLEATFKELGITVKPTALRLPDDLDVLDDTKVREWAVEQGLAEPPPPDTPEEEVAAHERVQAAGAGAAGNTGPSTLKPEDTAEWSTEKLLAFKNQHPEAFEALKRGESVSGVTW